MLSRTSQQEVAEGDYYTIPRIETICDAESVPNFVIGRTGYGSIAFNAPVNLIGVSTLSLLRDIVTLQKASVEVYPHASDPPKIGVGINIPAQICLENVYPDGVDMDDFVATLKGKFDTEFVSYDTENGIWKFNVNHFSTYTAGHSTWYSGIRPIHRREVSTSTESSRLGGASPHRNPSSTRSSSKSASPSGESSIQQSGELEYGRHQSLQSPVPVSLETTNVPSEHSLHQLRSSTQYHHEEQYVPRPRKLLAAFNNVYKPFSERQPIPPDAREKLEEFSLDSDQFRRLITSKELPRSRYIYLDEGKIKFDECTQPPHAEVIIEVVEQIAMQNRPFKLFDGGTGGGGCPYFGFAEMRRC